MAIQRMFPVGYMGTGIIPSEEGKAAAGATDGAWDKGAILIRTVGTAALTDIGYLTQGGTDPTKIIGVAEADGPQATTSQTKVRFIPAQPNVVFEATLSHGGTAVPLADSHVYAEFAVTKSGSGASALWYVNTVTGPDSSTARFRVTRLKDAVGTNDGRVFGVFTIDSTIYGIS